MESRNVKEMTLHVQSNNAQALIFYARHGFKVVEHLEDYYTDLEPSDCYVLVKSI